MPKVLADIVHEPEFVETDGHFKVGETVWALRWENWILGDIKQIRYDSGLNISRYRVVTQHTDFWTSKVDPRFAPVKAPVKTAAVDTDPNPLGSGGSYGEGGYFPGMGYDW